MKKIKNTAELRRAIAEGHHDFRVWLDGCLISRKTITPAARGRFKIVNHIDESVQRLTARQLRTHSIIGDAMRAGAFMVEETGQD
ncbi:MAG: hypothetical protein KGJ60_14365 [Verrucomicrobiota bacterium]|nr:hypothetical protein [Verrucomicrobiota bacterium]